jgi:hypothetical protein
LLAELLLWHVGYACQHCWRTRAASVS